MPFTYQAETTVFLLPKDGQLAEAEFLSALRNPFETYIIAYGFTLNAMIGEILAAHAAGVRIHIYLDHTQSAGTAEKPQVQRLVNAGVDVTIGTSPAGRGFICHSKALVVLDDLQNPYCWSGSVNFSPTGFKQVNTVEVRRSLIWATNFIEQFNSLKTWALENEPEYQLTPQPQS
jgi:phosphatidylserine/phosphatidylglycerophosphate/cardiolipin synthase-like enzyme